MKNTTFFLSMLILASIILTNACKKKTSLPPDEKEVIVPCSGPQYWTDNKVFRANAVGESFDQMTAKNKALSNARAELAASISTLLKGVTDNYVNSREFNNREEVEERYESLNREVVNQELNGIRTICERMVKTKDGKYKTYIAIELSSDKLIESYNQRMQRISRDERMRIDYDYEQFKKTFEREMEKLYQNRP